MAIDRAKDRAAVEQLIAERDQRTQDTAVSSEWMSHGLASMGPEPATDPQLIHMLPVAEADMLDSRQLAWSLYSQAQTEDPAVAEFKRGRADAGIKDMPWGQSGFNDK
jgi:hypothetical protein